MLASQASGRLAGAPEARVGGEDGVLRYALSAAVDHAHKHISAMRDCAFIF